MDCYFSGSGPTSGWGTLFINGAPTTAATAYMQIATWLVGSMFMTPCAQDSFTGNWSCELLEADGRQALAIWNPGGNATYVPPEQYVRYRDLVGTIASIGGGPMADHDRSETAAVGEQSMRGRLRGFDQDVPLLDGLSRG